MSQPQCTRSLSGFVFTWANRPYTLSLSRIRETSRGTTSELTVTYQNGGKEKILTQQTINLLSSKQALAKELSTKDREVPWVTMLEQVRVLALRDIRKGEPIQSLEATETDQPAWFVLNPLLYEKNPTVLYGPGDSYKSMLALYCGLLLASGCSGVHLACAPTPWKVLFLDWEMSVQDVRGRVKLLQAGDARLTCVPDYRRCSQPLADEAEALKKVIAEGGYDVLIIDSLAMAAGGQELERADSAIRFNAALRGLNCTSLVIGHTPKPQADQKERTLYGSVFFHNLCRVSWEVQRDGDVIGLYQRKNNLGRKHEPLGFTLSISDTEAIITDANLMDEPELAKGLSMSERVASYLAEHTSRTLDQIAEVLNINPKSLATCLSRTKKNGVRRFDTLNGIWNVIIK